MEVDEKQEKVKALISICDKNPAFEDRIHTLIRNTSFAKKNYNDLNYKEFKAVYQAAKINSELFEQDGVKLYTLIFDTYDDRMIDKAIYQKFKSVIG